VIAILLLPLTLTINEGVGGVSTTLVSKESEFLYGKFPKNFKWFTATAAYQIEGGWNDDGKTVDIMFLLKGVG
jgi:hypothetical protein